MPCTHRLSRGTRSNAGEHGRPAPLTRIGGARVGPTWDHPASSVVNPAPVTCRPGARGRRPQCWAGVLPVRGSGMVGGPYAGRHSGEHRSPPEFPTEGPRPCPTRGPRARRWLKTADAGPHGARCSRGKTYRCLLCEGRHRGCPLARRLDGRVLGQPLCRTCRAGFVYRAGRTTCTSWCSMSRRFRVRGRGRPGCRPGIGGHAARPGRAPRAGPPPARNAPGLSK